jgi:hypothetical protein
MFSAGVLLQQMWGRIASQFQVAKPIISFKRMAGPICADFSSL